MFDKLIWHYGYHRVLQGLVLLQRGGSADGESSKTIMFGTMGFYALRLAFCEGKQ